MSEWFLDRVIEYLHVVMWVTCSAVSLAWLTTHMLFKAAILNVRYCRTKTAVWGFTHFFTVPYKRCKFQCNYAVRHFYLPVSFSEIQIPILTCFYCNNTISTCERRSEIRFWSVVRASSGVMFRETELPVWHRNHQHQPLHMDVIHCDT